jgi:hypothetical protein
MPWAESVSGALELVNWKRPNSRPVQTRSRMMKSQSSRGGKNGVIVERYFTCTNGHSFKVMGEGDEPREGVEDYVTAPCPNCDVPIQFRWPVGRGYNVVPR